MALKQALCLLWYIKQKETPIRHQRVNVTVEKRTNGIPESCLISEALQGKNWQRTPNPNNLTGEVTCTFIFINEFCLKLNFKCLLRIWTWVAQTHLITVYWIWLIMSFAPAQCLNCVLRGCKIFTWRILPQYSLFLSFVCIYIYIHTTWIPEMMGHFLYFNKMKKKTFKSHEPIFYSQ